MNPAAVVVMKGGPHAGSSWADIVEWKRADLARVGFTYWGYGGTVCHPTRQVQPFAKSAPDAVQVAMIPTTSDPGNAPTPAQEVSIYGDDWGPLPDGITVTGSKWALVLDELEPCDDEIDLGEYVVGVGDRAGTPASGYLRHRVDKACLRHIDSWPEESPSAPRDVRAVTLRGRLVWPFAVFLR